MTLLSVNLNKIALVRNVRDTGEPDILAAARTCVEAGAGGITVHPRPDRRHTRPADVLLLADLTRGVSNAEFNVEGNPFPDFLDLVHAARPTQCTLVPDAPGAVTSDHGWDLNAEGNRLRPIIQRLKDSGIRVCLFLDPDVEQVVVAHDIGADRIELYTEPYAAAHGTRGMEAELELYAAAACQARDLGVGVNAGHDLSLRNIRDFLNGVPNVLEVSIGHALVSHAFEVGLAQAVRDYLDVMDLEVQQPEYA